MIANIAKIIKAVKQTQNATKKLKIKTTAKEKRDKITSDGERLYAALKELSNLQVRVGYQQGEAQDENGVDLVDIAIFNELGTVHIPARPFLRNSVDGNEADIADMAIEQLRQVTQLQAMPEQILNAIGVMITGLVQDTITKSKGWAEPLNEKTIERKGSDVPLIDKGGLLDSVHHIVVTKGSSD